MSWQWVQPKKQKDKKQYTVDKGTGWKNYDNKDACWTCHNPQCLNDRKQRLGKGPAVNAAAAKICHYCRVAGMTKAKADAIAEEAASHAFLEGTAPSEQPLTRKQKRRAAAAAKAAQSPASATTTPLPPSQPQGVNVQAKPIPPPPPLTPPTGTTSAPASGEDGTNSAQLHLAIPADKVEKMQFIAPLVEKMQASLKMSLLPKPRAKRKSVEDQIAACLEGQPDALAAQDLEQATIKRDYFKTMVDGLAPDASQPFRVACTKELEDAEAALAKLQKKPTAATSAAAAVDTARTKFRQDVVRRNARIKTAQDRTGEQRAARLAQIADAEAQLKMLKEEVMAQETLHEDAHVERAAERTTEEQEIAKGLDLKYAEASSKTAGPDATMPAAPAAAAGAPVADASAQLQAQLDAMKREMANMKKAAETTRVQEKQLTRYLRVEAIDESKLPEVTLPDAADDTHRYYWQLFYLLHTWQRLGCVPFTEDHLSAEFPDCAMLTGCIATLLGTYATAWHTGVEPSGALIMPNQCALLLHRQLQRVCKLADSEAGASAESDPHPDLQEKAMTSYAALQDRAKRLRLCR